MNKKLILILVAIIALASASDLALSLSNTKYTKAYDYWTVDVPVTGGSGNYKYDCQVPNGWSMSNNQFKVPSLASFNYNYEYVCRCKISDLQLNTFIERAIIFKPGFAGYTMAENGYYYGQTSYSSGLGSITGIDVLNKLTNLASSFTGSWSFSGSTSYLGGSTSSNLLSGLPSMTDCDKLIKDGNIVEIVALIQKVVSSNLRCDAKVAYLNDLLGRINAGLSIRK